MRTKKELFLRKVEKSPGCWLWKGSVNAHGYGNFTLNKQYVAAHRGAYLLLVGEIPVGMSVLHKCDNRKCVNPEHLFLGTQKDNIQDAISKNRFKWNLKGYPLSKEVVYQIKEHLIKGIPQLEIAQIFKVARSTVSAINTGQNWKEL